MEFNNKLKPQGVKSNTKGVQKALREHILSRYTDRDDLEGLSPVEALKGDVEAAAGSIEGNPRGEENLVKGGTFEVYHDQVKEFIDSLGLRQSKPEYSSDETWNLYTSLLSREIRNLINNPKLAEKLLKPIVPAAKPEGK
jgi:hypothetical protein